MKICRNISTADIVEEMNRSYADRVPYSDRYMGYAGNSAMEKLLAPLIARLEKRLAGKDVLERACEFTFIPPSPSPLREENGRDVLPALQGPPEAGEDGGRCNKNMQGLRF